MSYLSLIFCVSRELLIESIGAIRDARMLRRLRISAREQRSRTTLRLDLLLAQCEESSDQPGNDQQHGDRFGLREAHAQERMLGVEPDLLDQQALDADQDQVDEEHESGAMAGGEKHCQYTEQHECCRGF